MSPAFDNVKHDVRSFDQSPIAVEVSSRWARSSIVHHNEQIISNFLDSVVETAHFPFGAGSMDTISQSISTGSLNNKR